MTASAENPGKNELTGSEEEPEAPRKEGQEINGLWTYTLSMIPCFNQRL